MSQEQKYFENPNFSVEASDAGHCRLAVKVSVKPEPAQKAYQKAVKIVNKQISIPGFRKGHAPNQTVISRYSSYVDQEWKELVVSEAYRAALDLTQIYPLNKESISKPQMEQCSQEEGALVSFSYEHYPIVPQIDFSKLSIPTMKKEVVSESRIDEVIEEVRRANADWEEVADRAIEEGDFVDITIDAIDVDPPKSIVKDRRFEMSDQRLSPWLKKTLMGREVGESIEALTEVDPQAEEKIKKNFKATQVRITIHGIKRILLPDVNDELAGKAGASSLEDLRDKITRNLEKEAEETLNNKRMEALETALLETYHFDMPASILESERRERTAVKLQQLKEEGLTDDEIQRQQRDIERVVSDEIDHALRLYFLNKQIVKQGSISLSNQELNDEIVRYVSQNPYLYSKDTDESMTRDLVSRMASMLMQRKAKEYALDQIALTDRNRNSNS